jgi:hypothetical protein
MIPVMNDWEAWSSEHSFNVQEYFVLVDFARVALEISHISSPNGPPYNTYTINTTV